MATATVHIFEDTGVASAGAGTTATDVDGSSVKFGLADAVDASASPISVPANPGNNYSYAKSLYLDVTVAATTSTNLLNRQISVASGPTGLSHYFKAVNKGSYAQATGAAAANNTSANGTAPAGYAAVTSTPTNYDTATASSTATGQNGAYCVIATGVDGSYASGGGLSTAQTLTFTYSEQ